MTAEHLVAEVAAAYYGARGSGLGARLQPVMEIVERAHPGVVELSAASQNPGFNVQLAERPFPKRYEPELREAVRVVLGTASPEPQAPNAGILGRIIRAIRDVFSA